MTHFKTGILAAAAVLGLSATSTLSAQDSQPVEPQVEKTEASAADSAAKPYAFPTDAKDVELIELGEAQKITETHGHDLLVVNFWATWCAPCVAELPYFQASYEKHKHDGLQVVGFVMDKFAYEEEWPEYTFETIENKGLTFPNFQMELDPTVAVPWFSDKWEGALPATFYYDKSGKKVGERLGEVDKETLDADIQRLLAQANENKSDSDGE